MLKYIIALTIISTTHASLTCVAAEFNDPAKLRSKAAVCQGPVDGSITKQTEALTGNFDPSSFSDMAGDRKGQELFDTLLGGGSVTNDQIMAYLSALGMIAIPGIIFYVFNLCCCVCCTCCHSCCKICSNSCHLCKCIPIAARPYTKEEKCLPVFFWTVFSLIMFGFAGAGVVNGAYKLNDSLVSAVCLMDDTSLRFDAFLTNVKTPLDQLNIDFKKSVDDLTDAAVQDPQLSQNVRDIGNAFDVLANQAKLNKDAVLNAALKVECDKVWDALIAQATDAQTDIDAQATKIDKSLSDVQTEIQSSVIEASAAATEALAEGSATIATTQKQVADLLNPRSYSLIEFTAIFKGQKDSSAFGQYGWVFVAVVIGFLSILGMKMFSHEIMRDEGPRSNSDMWGDVRELKCPGKCFACCGCCSWFLTLWFGTLCALFAVIFLPIHAVGSDACLVIPTLPQNIGRLTNNPEISQITDTCWNQTGNLFTGLGLDKEIKVDGIDFSEFNEQFGGDGVSIDKEAIGQINTALDDIIDACYAAGTADAAGNTYTFADDRREATKFIVDTIYKKDGIRGMDNITHTEDAFNNNPAATKLITAGEATINTVKCAIKDFVAATGCYFIATTWDEVQKIMCGGVIGSFGWIGLSELLLAIIAVPYAITMLFILKRYGGHGPVRGDNFEDKSGQYGLDDKKNTGVEAEMVEIDAGDYAN